MPIFSFPDDNLSKRQWIFTKLGICIDIVEIWIGIANGQFRQILTELSARDTPIFSFPNDNLSKSQGILTKPGTCIDIKEVWFGIAYGQIMSMFDRVICPQFRQCVTELSAHDTIIAVYYSLTCFFIIFE